MVKQTPPVKDSKKKPVLIPPENDRSIIFGSLSSTTYVRPEKAKGVPLLDMMTDPFYLLDKKGHKARASRSVLMDKRIAPPVEDKKAVEPAKIPGIAPLENPPAVLQEAPAELPQMEKPPLPEPETPAVIDPERLYPARRLTSITDPKPGEVIVVLDANVLITLSHRIDDYENKTEDEKVCGIELIKRILGLPDIAKVVIPSYVLDFEVKNFARGYDENDQPLNSDRVTAIVRPYRDKQLDTLLHGAVRRHIDSKTGSVVYLTEPGVAPAEIDDSLIIWETEKGRDTEQYIYDTIHKQPKGSPEDEALARERGKQRIKDEYFGGSSGKNERIDRGEACIEEVTNKEMPWWNPCVIVSNDTPYIEKQKLATSKGYPKLYISSTTLMESLLRADSSLADKLDLCGDSMQQTNMLCKRISDRMEEGQKMTYPPFLIRGNPDHIEKFPSLMQFVPPGRQVQTSLWPIMRKASVTPVTNDHSEMVIPPSDMFLAPPGRALPKHVPEPVKKAFEELAKAKSSDNLLGKAIAEGMIACDLSFGGLAKGINALTPHMPEIDPKIIHGITSGRIKVLDDHLYAFIELLVDRNPAIGDADKLAAAHALLDAYHKSQLQPEHVEAHEHHSFREHVFDLVVNHDFTFDALAENLKEQLKALHLKPEEKIDARTVASIVTGETMPKAALALGLRKVLHADSTPEAAAEFDRAYIDSKYAEPGAREGVRQI